MRVTVSPFERVPVGKLVDADLLVIGGPTHAHGMSRTGTRSAARIDEKNAFEQPSPDPGLRGWLPNIPEGAGRAVATFDTRFKHSRALTGSAAVGIMHRLEVRGYQVAAPPESFFVGKDNALLPGEAARAEAWAEEVGGLLETVLST